MIASTPTPSKPFSRKSREAVSTIRSRFSAALSRLTRICTSILPLDNIYDDYHLTSNMTTVIYQLSGASHERSRNSTRHGRLCGHRRHLCRPSRKAWLRSHPGGPKRGEASVPCGQSDERDGTVRQGAARRP